MVIFTFSAIVNFWKVCLKFLSRRVSKFSLTLNLSLCEKRFVVHSIIIWHHLNLKIKYAKYEKYEIDIFIKCNENSTINMLGKLIFILCVKNSSNWCYNKKLLLKYTKFLDNNH